MNKNKALFLIIFNILGFSAAQANTGQDRTLYISNETSGMLSGPLVVTYQKTIEIPKDPMAIFKRNIMTYTKLDINGFDVSISKTRTALLEQTQQPNLRTMLIIPSINLLNDITIAPYGSYLKYTAFSATHLDIAEIKKLAATQKTDVLVKITSTYTGAYHIEILAYQKSNDGLVPASKELIDAFPRAARAHKENAQIEPRYILGVGEHATKHDIDEAYERLTALWHEGQFKFKNDKQFAGQVVAILKNAHEALIAKLEGKEIAWNPQALFFQKSLKSLTESFIPVK